MKLGGRGEPHGDELGRLALYLVSLGFADALDGNERLLGGVGHGLYGVIPRLAQLLNVSCTDAKALNGGRVRSGCLI